VRSSQFADLERSTCDGLEQRAVAAVGQANQGDAQMLAPRNSGLRLGTVVTGVGSLMGAFFQAGRCGTSGLLLIAQFALNSVVNNLMDDGRHLRQTTGQGRDSGDS